MNITCLVIPTLLYSFSGINWKLLFEYLSNYVSVCGDIHQRLSCIILADDIGLFSIIYLYIIIYACIFPFTYFHYTAVE